MVSKKLSFVVRGMSCAACSARVEKAAAACAGVEKASVNLLANTMSVQYDSAVFASDHEAAAAVVQAVQRAGYSAAQKNAETAQAANAFCSASGVCSASGSADTADAAIDVAAEQSASLKKRFIGSLCFLLPLMYISMYQMMPVPSIVLRIFDGAPNAMTFALSQFLLLLPILALNYSYFYVGFRNLFKLHPNMDSLIALGSSAACLYGITTLFRIGIALGRTDVVSVLHYRHDIYFESAAAILTFVTLGKWLEAKSK